MDCKGRTCAAEFGHDVVREYMEMYVHNLSVSSGRPVKEILKHREPVIEWYTIQNTTFWLKELTPEEAVERVRLTFYELEKEYKVEE